MEVILIFPSNSAYSEIKLLGGAGAEHGSNTKEKVNLFLEGNICNKIRKQLFTEQPTIERHSKKKEGRSKPPQTDTVSVSKDKI